MTYNLLAHVAQLSALKYNLKCTQEKYQLSIRCVKFAYARGWEIAMFMFRYVSDKVSGKLWHRFVNLQSFKNMPVTLISQFFKTRSGSLLSLKDFFPNAGKVKFWGKHFAFCHKKFMGQKVKSVPNKVWGRRKSKQR